VTTIAPDICETGIDVVYLLTVNPDHAFTLDQIDAVHDAQWSGFVTIAGSALRPKLVPGISYCATCLVGCEHETGQPASCEHALCWGADATGDCLGRTFEKLAIERMRSHDWQLAEIRLNATAVAR
jgi:hypothetical protein